MKKLLVVCYDYNHDNSINANAICVNEIIKRLDFENINVITTHDTKDGIKVKKTQNISVHSISINKSSITGKLLFKEWENRAKNYIVESKLVSKDTVILTVSFPFNMHNVGLYIKEQYKEIKWLCYELDPFAYNEGLRFAKSAKPYRLIKEKRIFSQADRILLTHELYREYSMKGIFQPYYSKFYDIGIPALIEFNIKEGNTDKSTYKLIFTGSFYKKLRNPKYMLNILNILVERYEYELHIFGPSLKEVENYLDGTKSERLIVHSRVGKSELTIFMENMDFFVNVGNSVENQVPSKIFDYISFGKPIINFYSIEKDTSEFYLKNYPLYMGIRENTKDIESVVKELDLFIRNFKGIIPDIEENERMFEKYTISNFIEKFNTILST